MKYEYVKLNNKNVRVCVFAPGDSQLIETELPMVGVIGFNHAIVNAYDYQTLNPTNLLIVNFRYSVDSIHYTEMEPFNDGNVAAISGIIFNHPVMIEYSVTNDSSETLVLQSIEVDFDFKELPVHEKYEKTFLNEIIPFYNRQSLNWSVNVLQKIFKKGIVPSYIKRYVNENWKDKDYIDFWWVLIYLQALKMTYFEIFGEVQYRLNLAKEFLKQRNVFISKNEDLTECYYQILYYHNLMRERGTIIPQKVKTNLPPNFKNVQANGELLNLVEIDSNNDFEKYYLIKHDNGIFVGTSFTLFPSTTSVDSYIKPPIIIDNNSPLYGQSIFTVNTNLLYQITFKFKINKKGYFGNQITIELVTYDSNLRIINGLCPVYKFGLNSNFICNDETIIFEEGVDYFFKGYIYPYNTTSQYLEHPNIGVGNNLKFLLKETKYISLKTLDGSNMTFENFDFRLCKCLDLDYLSQGQKLIVVGGNSIDLDKLNLKKKGEKFLVDYKTDFIYIS